MTARYPFAVTSPVENDGTSTRFDMRVMLRPASTTPPALVSQSTTRHHMARLYDDRVEVVHVRYDLTRSDVHVDFEARAEVVETWPAGDLDDDAAWDVIESRGWTVTRCYSRPMNCDGLSSTFALA